MAKAATQSCRKTTARGLRIDIILELGRGTCHLDVPLIALACSAVIYICNYVHMRTYKCIVVFIRAFPYACTYIVIIEQSDRPVFLVSRSVESGCRRICSGGVSEIHVRENLRIWVREKLRGKNVRVRENCVTKMSRQMACFIMVWRDVFFTRFSRAHLFFSRRFSRTPFSLVFTHVFPRTFCLGGSEAHGSQTCSTSRRAQMSSHEWRARDVVWPQNQETMFWHYDCVLVQCSRIAGYAEPSLNECIDTHGYQCFVYTCISRFLVVLN